MEQEEIYDSFFSAYVPVKRQNFFSNNIKSLMIIDIEENHVRPPEDLSCY